MYKLIGAVILGLASAGALASEHLPMSGSDVARYAPAASTSATHESRVIGTEGPQWKLLSDFMGLGETWVRTEQGSEDVWVFNAEQNRSYRLANFAAAVGSRWNLRLGACNNAAKLAARGETVSTRAGNFANTVRLDFSSTCADGGLVSAWFAPGVGLVKWSAQSIAGPRDIALVDAQIAGQRYGTSSIASVGLELKASFPGPRVLSNVTPTVPVRIEVVNTATTPMELTFNSSQRFDIMLFDAEGELVNSWSATRRFAQVATTMSIAAGASEVFGGEIDLTSLVTGQPLDVGTYRLRVELKGHATPTATAFVQGSPMAVEAPLYVDRRMTIGH